MRAICSPQTEVDLAVIKSLLEAEHIPYFVHNENYGALEIGVQIPLVNTRTIMVPEQFEQRAREIIAAPVPVDDAIGGGTYAWKDRLRMVLEALSASHSLARRQAVSQMRRHESRR